MTDLFRLLAEWLAFLWPLRIVRAWERGVVLVLGHARREVGPGLYPVVPWFVDIHIISVAPAILVTPMLTVTLSDDRTLTFSAAATVHVEDATAALVAVDDYRETVGELLAATLAQRLAEVDTRRLDTAGRGRLVSDLRRWLDGETSAFGVRVTALRFTTFALNLRTLRLLTDRALPETLW